MIKPNKIKMILSKALNKYDEFNYTNCFTCDDKIAMYKMMLNTKNEIELKEALIYLERYYGVALYDYYDYIRSFALDEIKKVDSSYFYFTTCLDPGWYKEKYKFIKPYADDIIFLLLKIAFAIPIFKRIICPNITLDENGNRIHRTINYEQIKKNRL